MILSNIIRIGLNINKTTLQKATTIFKLFKERVIADGGVVEGDAYVTNAIRNNITEYNSSILYILPSGYKINKLYSQKASNDTSSFPFTRNSIATRINSSGAEETLTANIPRIDHLNGFPELFVEAQATQLYELTATMATQTKTVTAVAHTVSFYGTGTITFSGVFVGTLVGTGATNRVSLTFTPTAGALVSTVTGSVLKSQLETGSVATSYIPNTGIGTVIRESEVYPITTPANVTQIIEVTSLGTNTITTIPPTYTIPNGRIRKIIFKNV